MRRYRSAVCRHEALRIEIDLQLVGGMVAAQIYRSLSPAKQARVSESSIRNHGKEHLNFQHARESVRLHEKMERLAETFDVAKDSLVDGKIFLMSVIERAYIALTSGRVEPTLQNGIAAAQLLVQIEQIGGGDTNVRRDRRDRVTSRSPAGDERRGRYDLLGVQRERYWQIMDDTAAEEGDLRRCRAFCQLTNNGAAA
jgi:hypothetical protein